MTPLLSFITFTVGALLRPVLFRALAMLGIGLITYTGVDAGIETISGLITTRFDDLGAQSAQILGILQLDKFCSMILSAYAIKISLNFTNKAIGVR